MRHKIFVVLLTFLAIGLGTTPRTFADSSGPRNGSSFSNDATVGNVAWSTPSNAQTSNNVWATAAFTVTGDISNYLKATGFGFTIPTDATIDGIKVEFERSKNISGLDTIQTFSIRLVKGGVISGTDLTAGDLWETTDTYQTYGGTTEKWGLTWTAADINASNFGVVVSAETPELTQTVTARIDHIRITVSYTPAATTPSTPPSAGGRRPKPGVISFEGRAYPQGTMLVFFDQGTLFINRKIESHDGSFSVKAEVYDPKKIEYQFHFIDREGRGSPLVPYAIDVALDRYYTVNVTPPPTVSLQKSLLTKGETLFVRGTTSPGEVVEIVIDGKAVTTIKAGSMGSYAATVNTATVNIKIGAHNLTVRRKIPGQEYLQSLVMRFVVSPFGVVRGDFNDDGIVNILDWSIFVGKKKDPTFAKKLDLNLDQKVDVIDLSIFLRLIVL